ncbi:MAG: Alpha-L-arabinofuranosidase-like protein, partial [Verrucomicrobiales bacterium]|nr:Alpha-L-arabinofuranosidase-like protein [Verrucomicrobiales bacterium]
MLKSALILVWMLCLGFSVSGQAIYSDSLQSGWVSYGWANLNFNSTTPVAHGGSKSISVTPTGSYQALFLHHDAIDSSLFTNLSFWINAGNSSSQKLQVQAQLTGQQQPAVKITNLVANTWVPVVISMKDLGVANKPNFDGFWIQDVSGGTGPPFYVDDISLVSLPPPSQVNIAVDASNVIRQIDSRMFGLNTAVWDSAFDTSTTTDFLKELDIRVLRFPGGSLSDEYHWQSNTTFSNTWQWATSFEKFLHVATNTSAQPIIT